MIHCDEGMNKLVDFVGYTDFEIFLFTGGCALWVLVYAIYVKNIIKYKFIEMPAFAGAADIGWEFTWSFVTCTTMGVLFQRAYQLWFFMDCFIFYGIIRYGWQQLATPQLRPYWGRLCLLAAVCWAAVFSAMQFSVPRFDTPIGTQSTYFAQMCISTLYILQIVRAKSLANYSFTVAWARTVGTGMITVFVNVYDGCAENYFLRVAAIIATTLDCSCFVLFLRKRRALAAATDAG